MTKSVEYNSILGCVGSKDKLTEKMHIESVIWTHDDEVNQAPEKFCIVCGIRERFTICSLQFCIEFQRSGHGLGIYGSITMDSVESIFLLREHKSTRKNRESQDLKTGKECQDPSSQTLMQM